MEETDPINRLAGDLVLRNEQLKTALEACKTLQARLAAAERLAEACEVMFRAAGRYDYSWSVPDYLSDEPTVTELRAALADWREANGGEHGAL